MSVKVMSCVFDRYTNGGGEMLLALALADHASDDGSRIYPGIKHLAVKTRQGERSVQYQLRRMELAGWLILVNSGNGGRNQRREYQISPDWLKGAEIAPPLKGATDDIKGATDDAKGCNPQHERVQPVAPAYNHHITIIEPSKKGSADAPLSDVSVDLLNDWIAVRKVKKAGPITKTVMAGIQREADKAGITLSAAITACCEFGWQGFNADWFAQRQPSAAMPANRQTESFAERDARAGRESWERMTGKQWPADEIPGAARTVVPFVIDVEPIEIKRLSA